MDWLSNLFGGISKGIGSLFGGGGSGKSSVADLGNGGYGQITQGGVSNVGGQAINSMVPFSMSNMGMGNNAASGGAAGGGSGGGSFLNSIFKNPAAGLGGLGVMGLGQMMNKPQKMPDFNQNPAVQQLQGWQNQASHPMDPNVQTAMQNTLNIQNEQQLRNLRDVYKNLRPGTDYTTDTNYQRDLGNLNRSIASQNADAMAGQQFNSNQQQLGNLTNMAQLGVGQQMGQAGLDAQRQQQQNQMFGNIGSMLLQSGIGMPDFMKLFSGGK